MRSINPSYKFIGILVITLAYTLTASYRLNLAVSLILLLLLLLSRVSFIKIIKTLIPVTIGAFGMFMTAFLFSKQTTTQDISINTIASYDYALLISSRIYVFALLGMLFSYTTNMMDFMFSLRDQLKIPDFYIYGIFASVNLLPTIKTEVKKNQLAFQARGKKAPLYSSRVLMPLFTKIILYSDRLAMAMSSKDFAKDQQRTYYTKIETSLIDKVFGIVCLLLSCLLIIYR